MSGELWVLCGLSHHRALPTRGREVGWRLAQAAWGRGPQDRRPWCAVISPSTLHLDRLISITIEANVRSSRVMEKLGMRRWRTMPFEDWTLSIWAMTAADRAA